MAQNYNIVFNFSRGFIFCLGGFVVFCLGGVVVFCLGGVAPVYSVNSPHASRFRRYGIRFLRSQQPKHFICTRGTPPKHLYLYKGDIKETYSFVCEDTPETFICVCEGQERKNRHRFLPPRDCGTAKRGGKSRSEWGQRPLNKRAERVGERGQSPPKNQKTNRPLNKKKQLIPETTSKFVFIQ